MKYNGLPQGCSLGLDVSVSRRSFQMSRSHGNVGRSRSRLGLKIKCLGLVSVSYHRVSFTSQCAQLSASLQNCTYIVLNTRRLYCLLIHKFTYLLQCKCISRCHLYGCMPRPRRPCVRWEPSPPYQGHSSPPPIFGRCLFWKNDRPSQLLLSNCHITSDTFLARNHQI